MEAKMVSSKRSVLSNSSASLQKGQVNLAKRNVRGDI